MNLHKKPGLHHFLAPIVPYLHAKDQKNVTEPILRKILNKRTDERTNTGEIIGPIRRNW